MNTTETTRSKPNGEFQYSIRISGTQLVKGDVMSVGVIFRNLDGKNNLNECIETQAHLELLDFMAKEFKVAMDVGLKIELISPGGLQLRESVIGRSAHA